MVSKKLLWLQAIFHTTAAEYTLTDLFTPQNFFSEFEFFNAPDPTAGSVRYVSAVEANAAGLAGYAQDAVYLGVDYTTTFPPTAPGRPSTRVQSKKSWPSGGLFVADIAHMPAGQNDTGSCGLWPAFWTYNRRLNRWPQGGEIDIIEGVNSHGTNSVVLHTDGSCPISGEGTLASTTLARADCAGDVGCRQQLGVEGAYGAEFNRRGGGVYVLEWTASSISVWFFPRESGLAKTLSIHTPGINSTRTQTVSTAGFGQPVARFASTPTCDLSTHFSDQSIVFNTDFCGGWAGKDWSTDAVCSKLARTCEEYVGANPGAFEDAYWLINSVKVYQDRRAQVGGQPGVRRRTVRFES
ncbi:concanavalin A-like lectin/glucanase domain-containing protein [Echria macrotheca]|uniref:Concanavalin A-like lectin/glucanase domain-containing protein n=1 Tax=Echria macrotheca TaxID=438768 RepID=A0AAJ0BHX1_9PEZI|nr:concanavalin A-like lectin/glucanase domain-containing protein [Echria macrotheca]